MSTVTYITLADRADLIEAAKMVAGGKALRQRVLARIRQRRRRARLKKEQGNG